MRVRVRARERSGESAESRTESARTGVVSRELVAGEAEGALPDLGAELDLATKKDEEERGAEQRGA